MSLFDKINKLKEESRPQIQVPTEREAREKAVAEQHLRLLTQKANQIIQESGLIRITDELIALNGTPQMTREIRYGLYSYIDTRTNQEITSIASITMQWFKPGLPDFIREDNWFIVHICADSSLVINHVLISEQQWKNTEMLEDAIANAYLKDHKSHRVEICFGFRG